LKISDFKISPLNEEEIKSIQQEDIDLIFEIKPEEITFETINLLFD